MAYIHLDIVLKYTFKTLSGMSVKDALDQMHKNRTSFVRKRIRRLFSDKQPDPEDFAQLEALLDDAKTLSRKRNALFHSMVDESGPESR